MQFAWTFAGLAIQSRHCGNRIECDLECHRIVPVGTRDRDGQWSAARVYDDVPFRTEPSPGGRIGTGFVASIGLGTLAPSTMTRSQSIWSSLRNRRSIADPVSRTRLRLASLVAVVSRSFRSRNRVHAASLPWNVCVQDIQGATQCRRSSSTVRPSTAVGRRREHRNKRLKCRPQKVGSGCRLHKVCEELGRSARTFQRWVGDGDAARADGRSTANRP